MKVFKIQENGINMVWKVADTGCVRLLHFSALPFDERTIVDDTRSRASNFWSWRLQVMTDRTNVTEPNIL